MITAPALIAVTVVTYLVSAFAVGRIRHQETPPHPDTRRPLKVEIAEGLQFVVHEPYLRRIVACTSLGNFAGAIAGAVTVIYVLRTLGLGTAAYGAVLSAGSIGALLGAARRGPARAVGGRGTHHPAVRAGHGPRRRR